MFGGLKDKVALVTGAAGGIGKASAKRLSKEGCKIFAVDISEKALQIMKDEFAAEGLGEIETMVVDMSNEEEVKSCVQACVDRFGTVDINLNTAGIYNDALVVDMSLEVFQQTMDVNLKSIFLINRAVAPIMMEKHYGRIINTSSQAGVSGSITHAHYSASKAAIIGFSRTLARELAPYNVTVNCLAPGIIKTAMTNRYTPEQAQNFMAKIPLGRFGEPDEVAKVVEFVASDGGDYLTGQVFNITGGWLMIS